MICLRGPHKMPNVACFLLKLMSTLISFLTFYNVKKSYGTTYSHCNKILFNVIITLNVSLHETDLVVKASSWTLASPSVFMSPNNMFIIQNLWSCMVFFAIVEKVLEVHSINTLQLFDWYFQLSNVFTI